MQDTADLSLIFDATATLAIVLTLIFLALELRLTRKQAELANWRDVLQAFTDYKGLTADPTLAAIVVKGASDRAALTEPERLSFDLYLEQGIHICGNFLKHNDALPRKLTGLEEALANTLHDLLTTPGGAAWWAEAQTRGRFMSDTYRIVNGLLARRAAHGAALKG